MCALIEKSCTSRTPYCCCLQSIKAVKRISISLSDSHDEYKQDRRDWTIIMHQTPSLTRVNFSEKGLRNVKQINQNCHKDPSLSQRPVQIVQMCLVHLRAEFWQQNSVIWKNIWHLILFLSRILIGRLMSWARRRGNKRQKIIGAAGAGIYGIPYYGIWTNVNALHFWHHLTSLCIDTTIDIICVKR